MRETPTHAVISVRDFGTGISEEDLPKLLNPEIHYTTYGTKNEEGSGIFDELKLHDTVITLMEN